MASAVDAIATKKSFWDSARAAGNTYMNFTFGCGQDSEFAKSIFKEKKSVQDAWKEAKLGESYWAQLKNAFTPSKMGEEWKLYREGAEGVKAAGAIRSAGRFFMKRMPFVMNAVFLAMEVPNVYKAFMDKEHGGGVATGATEVVKTGLKMTGMAAGAAIGSLIIPWLGGAIGGLAGGFLGSLIADKVLGERFSDKVKEKEEKAKQAQQAPQQPLQESQQPAQSGQSRGFQGLNGNPYSISPFGQTGMPSRNSIFQMDWKDKDIMALGVGLT
jgi:hypothetical protein